MKSSLRIKILRSVTGDSQDGVADQETKNPQVRQMQAEAGLPLPQRRQDVYQDSRTKHDKGIEERKGHSHPCPVFMDRPVDLDLAGCKMRHFRKRLLFCDYLRGSGHHSLLPEHPLLKVNSSISDDCACLRARAGTRCQKSRRPEPSRGAPGSIFPSDLLRKLPSMPKPS